MPLNAQDDTPIVIAHRGASGYLPEHTLAAYRLGMEQGADYIEPDLVLTKDGHLVARHDIYLSTTTDIKDHPEFADRKRSFNGKEDWYVFDFTLKELKTLYAKQPFASRDQSHNQAHRIPTFDEILSLVNDYNQAHDTVIGLYPEMKQPEVFINEGQDPTDKLLTIFEAMDVADIPFYFQCFDPNFIVQLRPKTKAQLIMLMYEVKDEVNGGMKQNIPFALVQNSIDGIGISKGLLVDDEGRPTPIVKTAHNLGLKVHVWTIRDDMIPKGFVNSAQEMKAIFNMGVDGVFADFPDTARAVVNTFTLAEKVTGLE
ncbi:glycerophosphodiester phosphodiesterase family protein [Kordiimonas sp. SCSIO 12610]|uniref:glycerophosphodiester phosphodiesterase family protein n=1 Tax=Kordiimonas sp. SCSIO 12610 TaxID=2829597 RepID=UPI00210EDA73|nr:glycerophosphodiester phosphodiesterase family protein [Kordiimonas sp. SCSIO 12610]UTW53829.1 hypothetical protein KFF44_08205 [Kordiimonas sp. SCSIO 12610]